MEELGGARTHNTRSGNAHYLATDEDDAIDYVRALLSYLPSNNLEDPPAYEEDTAETEEDTASADELDLASAEDVRAAHRRLSAIADEAFPDGFSDPRWGPHLGRLRPAPCALSRQRLRGQRLLDDTPARPRHATQPLPLTPDAGHVHEVAPQRLL